MNKYFLPTIFLLLIFCFFIASDAESAACANIPISGNATITADCAFDGIVNGVEQGNLTISGTDCGGPCTLTINAAQTIAFNPGQRVTLEPGAKIALNTNGRLSVSYIWLKDQDGNRYPATTTIASRDTPGEGWQRRDYFRTEWATTSKSVWNYVENIKYDFNDTNAAVYPGTGCGYGRACDVNSDAGTCVEKPAECLSNCTWCNGTSFVAENISDQKFCSGGSEVDPSQSVYCDNVLSCTNSACSGTRYYRGCNGSGGCRTDNTGAASATEYADIHYVCYSNAWQYRSSSYYCSTAFSCTSGSCSGTRYYRGCAGGSTSCRTSNTGADSATEHPSAGQVCGGSDNWISPTATYKCATGYVCNASFCASTPYYRGCNTNGTCNSSSGGTAGTPTTCAASQKCVADSGCVSGCCASNKYCASATNCAARSCHAFCQYFNTSTCNCSNQNESAECASCGSWTTCGSCSYPSTCAESGTGSRSRTCSKCANGACTPWTETDPSCACSRNTSLYWCGYCRACFNGSCADCISFGMQCDVGTGYCEML